MELSPSTAIASLFHYLSWNFMDEYVPVTFGAFHTNVDRVMSLTAVETNRETMAPVGVSTEVNVAIGCHPHTPTALALSPIGESQRVIKPRAYPRTSAGWDACPPAARNPLEPAT